MAATGTLTLEELDFMLLEAAALDLDDVEITRDVELETFAALDDLIVLVERTLELLELTRLDVETSEVLVLELDRTVLLVVRTTVELDEVVNGLVELDE